MARVSQKNEYEPFDRMFNRFRKAVADDNVVKVYCEKSFYEKPTAVRKKAKDMAKKRLNRKLSEERNALKIMRLQHK